MKFTKPHSQVTQGLVKQAHYWVMPFMPAVLVAMSLLIHSTNTFAVSSTEPLTSSQLKAEYGARLEKLFEKARVKGKVPVIIQLKTVFRPEGMLNKAQADNQRTDIAARQVAVLDRLGSRFAIEKTSVKKFKFIPFLALVVTQEQLDALRNDPDVLAIEEDAQEFPLLYESVPHIGGDVAHNLGYTGSGQYVVVIDSGVIQDHQFLSGQIEVEACFSTNILGGYISLCPGGATESTATGSARDCPTDVGGCGHGTHVAGIVAGKRTTTTLGEMSGVAPGAKIIAIKTVTLDVETGKSTYFQSDIARALELVNALKEQFTIASVNLSLGGGRFETISSCDSAHSSEKAIIDTLRSSGIATVAASGNDGWTDAMNAPACISSVISVGNATKSDTVYPSSNSAYFLTLLAPGTSIFSSGAIISAVSAGDSFSCGLSVDRQLVCWGSLGLYTSPTDTFTQISVGAGHGCGVRKDQTKDQTLECWGWAEHGEASPPPGKFRQVSAGYLASCGVRSDATLACWGLLENPDHTSLDPPTGSFAQVGVSKGSSNYGYACGLRTDGTIACWGSKDNGQTEAPSGVFSQVSVGGGHACGLRTNGSVVCWGDNWEGVASPPPYVFSQISAGGTLTCGIRVDAGDIPRAVCWGSGFHGQTTPPSDSYTVISAGWATACGVRSVDGVLECWGQNDQGQSTAPTFDPSGYVGKTGTSMAAPHVAGAVAVLKSKKSDATTCEIIDALRSTGTPITRNSGWTFPRIDLASALDAVGTIRLSVNFGGSGSGMVISSPAGINCNGNCTARFSKDTQVSLTAYPDSGSTFSGWFGSACSGTEACTVTMDCPDALNNREVVIAAEFSLDPLILSTTSLPVGEQGAAYLYALQAEGGTPPYTWSRIQGKLPKGLTLDAAGTLSGTPTKAKTATVTVRVIDDAGASATQTLSLQIVKDVDLKTKKLSRGTIGTPYAATLTTNGGIPPLTFDLVGGALPPGLTFDPDTGQVSGTPTEVGTFDFQMMVTSSGGSSDQGTIRIKIKQGERM